MLQDVVKIVNAICPQAKKCWLFSELCKDMSADHMVLLHSEVRWLPRGRVLERVLSLKNELSVFFTEQGDVKAMHFNNDFWLAKLWYMTSIFEHFNRLNLSPQGKGGDIFDVLGKIEAMKM